MIVDRGRLERGRPRNRGSIGVGACRPGSSLSGVRNILPQSRRRVWISASVSARIGVPRVGEIAALARGSLLYRSA
jgi:hypothetical protein